jgi:arylsulfatase A-like enzyme
METPRIDAFAETGMIFTDGYAPAANCQPSRACLLAGQYTPRHDVYAVKSTKRGNKKLMRLEPVPNKSGIPEEDLSIADALKLAGYRTGIFGKWHSGPPDGCHPLKQGFDVYVDSSMGGNPNLSTGEIQEDPIGIFSMTQSVQEFMQDSVAQQQPFFAFMSHHAIHTALEGRKETVEYFQNKATTKQERELAVYAACTKDLDTGVGMLLDTLDALGIADNTLVVFTSDNGSINASSQEPLRGNKGAYYEGGIREPFILRWPGLTKPGSKNGTPVSNIDLFPTFADAAGAKIPGDKILDGETLRPLCTGGELERSAMFWHFPGYLDRPVIRGRDPLFRTRPVSVIRKGDWKLHLYHEEWLLDGGREKLATNRAVELYNLKTDIGERVDLNHENTAKRDELLNDLLAWFESTDAKLAAKK